MSQMDLAFWSYALPLIRHDFDLTTTQVGLLTGAAFAVGGVILVSLGVLTDRVGRKKTLIGSVLSSSVFVASHAFASNVAALGLLRAGSIATGGLLYPVTGALVTEEAPQRVRGLMTGSLQIAYPIGWFFASILAVIILPVYGWRALFLIGIVLLPAAVLAKRTVRESTRFINRSGDVKKSSLPQLLSQKYRRRTVLLFIAQYAFVVSYGGAFLFSPIYFHDARGFDIANTALLIGVSNMVGVFGYLSASWVGEFYLTRRTTTVVWTLAGATCFSFFLWMTNGYGETLIAFAVMAFFSLGAAAVKFTYIAEQFPTEIRATGLAFCGSFAVTLGQATGPMLIGWLADTWGWNVAMMIGGVLPLYVAGGVYLKLEAVPSGLDVDEIQRRLVK